MSSWFQWFVPAPTSSWTPWPHLQRTPPSWQATAQFGRLILFTSMWLGVSFRTWAVARLLMARTASASPVWSTTWAFNVITSCWSCCKTRVSRAPPQTRELQFSSCVISMNINTRCLLAFHKRRAPPQVSSHTTRDEPANVTPTERNATMMNVCDYWTKIVFRRNTCQYKWRLVDATLDQYWQYVLRTLTNHYRQQVWISTFPKKWE